MKKHQTPRSIRLIYFFTKLFFWLTASISAIALCIITYITFGGSLAAEISFGSPYTYSNFNELPAQFKGAMMLSALSVLTSVVLVLFYFKRFMKLIYEGRYFDLKTIKNLKLISYLLTIIFFIQLIGGVILGLIFGTSSDIIEQSKSEGINLTFTLESPSLDILIISLIFWVLSHIFMEGAKLKEANELTI